MDLGVFQSHDERSQHAVNSELREKLDSGLNSRDERMLESAGGASAYSPNANGRNHRMLRTVQISPLGTYKDSKTIDEINLRKTLVARINNYLPAHKHEYCEKRF
jgi:hypothetical protein